MYRRKYVTTSQSSRPPAVRRCSEQKRPHREPMSRCSAPSGLDTRQPPHTHEISFANLESLLQTVSHYSVVSNSNGVFSEYKLVAEHSLWVSRMIGCVHHCISVSISGARPRPCTRHHLGNLVLFLQYKNSPLFHATIVRFVFFFPLPGM